ncbi:iron ABC transporter substrate-binding protein [Arthrobacter sp. H5]|uniref:iron ABC transporter substrate-binding protein n=1 Tax=Arthrobacter sp. H5 TaxID=1267973 RepID=UPI000487446F|nr:iron ABC transporter substrate-binding protein [Arthrobacter sp. H5]
MPAPHRLAALAATTALILTGCGAASEPSAEQEPVESASMESDDALTVYSGRDEDLVQPLIDMFEEQSGIEVEVRYANTPELGALLLEEGEQSPAQVFLSQDAGALGALSTAGLFSTLPEEITGTVPAGFTSADDTWVGVTGRARVIVYDGESLADDEVPTSVDTLTEPEWSGRVGIAPSNASFQAFITAYRVLNGEEAADEWVAGLAANDPQIFENNGAVLAAVNEGVVDTGLINHYYWFAQAAEVGEENMRAQLSYPEAGDAGSIVNVTGAGVLTAGAEDAEAYEFVKFLVSEEAQQYFVEETFEYPLLEGVESPEGLPGLDTLVNPELDLSDLESLEVTQELLSKHGLI